MVFRMRTKLVLRMSLSGIMGKVSRFWLFIGKYFFGALIPVESFWLVQIFALFISKASSMLLVLFSMIQNASLPVLEDVPYVVKNEVFWKRKVYQRWENCFISSVSGFLSSRTGLILQFPSKVVFLYHFWRENVNSGHFYFKTRQILKPGVGPAIHIFLQVKIIFEDSIVLIFTLWFETREICQMWWFHLSLSPIGENSSRTGFCFSRCTHRCFLHLFSGPIN